MSTLEIAIQPSGNAGAIAALKGYRVQALYTIYTVLINGDADTYIPEGREDVDILAPDGKIKEYIQIKNYSDALSLSNIAATTGASFIGRCLEIIKAGELSNFKLVSFGIVGPELKKLFSDQTSHKEFRKRLKQYNSDLRLLDSLKDHFEIVECNEKEIEQLTVDALKSVGLNTDTEISLDLLHFWIYRLSEQQERLTKKSLIKKIADIGKFETKRAEYYKHYQISIRSFSEKVPAEEEKEKLRNQFYLGMGASYQHVLSGADVLRQDYLSDINSKLDSTDVLIVHGASGQGKSTLAYRYIHNYYSSELAFQVELSDDEQFTLAQIETLKGMAKSIDIPILLYLDVPPGNISWVRFLKTFSASDSLKFFVTIREDDWTRSPGKGVDFDFDDLELKFTENEAKEIYARLNSLKTDLVFTDFDEAWIHFGGSGPLLEFTYLITQGESLKARLEQQLRAITNIETKEVLRIVAFADSMGAKINVQELVKEFLGIHDIILSLEREFLIRSVNEGASLVGLHPVRSSIISKYLIDDFTFYTKDYVIKCLNLVQEYDRYTFLVNSFLNYNLNYSNLESHVLKVKSLTWSGRNGLLQALLWKGIADYVKRNEEVFISAYQLLDDAWYLGIRLNFGDTGYAANLLKTSGLTLAPETIEGMHIVEEKQTNLEEIYYYSIAWLKASDFVELDFGTERAARDFGEFAYWTTKLVPEIRVEFNQENLAISYENYSLDTMSDVLLGASFIVDVFKLKKFQNIFLEKLRTVYRIPIIELNEERIKVHFLIDLINDVEGRETSVHSRTIEIIDQIRKAFPNHKTYCTQGYGHLVTGLPMNDATTKNIPVDALPLPNLIELNVRTINLFEFRYRPENWEEYVKLVLERRMRNINVLKGFNDALVSFFKSGNFSILMDFLDNCNVDELKVADVLFPKNISDQSGTISERSSEERIKRTPAQTMRLAKLKKYQKSYFSYSSSLSTSVSFALTAITDRFLNKDRKLNEKLALLNAQNAFEELNAFQKNFDLHYSKFCDSGILKNLTQEENNSLKSFIGLWRAVFLDKTQFMRTGAAKVISELNSVRSDFDSKLKASLKKNAKENNYEVKYYRNEKENATYILINVSNPIVILHSLLCASRAIHSIIQNPNPLSTKGFMLKSNYPKFTMVPTVMGKLINRQVYEWPLHIFQAELFEGVKTHHMFPRPIAQWFLKQNKIEVYEDLLSELKLIDNFVLQYSLLSTHVGQIAQAKVVADRNDLDERGSEIIATYCNNSTSAIQSSYTWLTQYLARHRKDYEDLKDDYSSLDYENGEFLKAVLQAYLCIMPNQDEEQTTSNLTLRLEDFPKWKERLDSISVQMNIVHYYVLKKEIFSLWRCEKQPWEN